MYSVDVRTRFAFLKSKFARKSTGDTIRKKKVFTQCIMIRTIDFSASSGEKSLEKNA